MSAGAYANRYVRLKTGRDLVEIGNQRILPYSNNAGSLYHIKGICLVLRQGLVLGWRQGIVTRILSLDEALALKQAYAVVAFG